MMPPNESIHQNGFTKVLFNILLIVPLVVAGYFYGLAGINANDQVISDDFIYDYREIYTNHVQYRKEWGTDSFLLFKVKKYYFGVLKYERPSLTDQTYAGLDLLSSFFNKLALPGLSPLCLADERRLSASPSDHPPLRLPASDGGLPQRCVSKIDHSFFWCARECD